MSENVTPTPPADAGDASASDGVNNGPVQLPDDHPLVKSLAAQKAEIKALKEKASRLDQIEEAQKTAEQKAAERLAEAERKAAEAEAKMAVAEAASASGVPADILAGPEDRTPEGLRAFADKINHYAEAAAAPRAPKPDLNQGRQNLAHTTTAEMFAASMAGRI